MFVAVEFVLERVVASNPVGISRKCAAKRSNKLVAPVLEFWIDVRQQQVREVAQAKRTTADQDIGENRKALGVSFGSA